MEPAHKRRPRYRGTHPRKFGEKYKELQPEAYAADVEKVIAAGKTPAGTHRPILVKEILEFLQPKPGQTAVDCTLGYGGHARELLPRLQPGGILHGLDVDPLELPRTEQRLRDLGYGPETFRAHRMNYAGLPALLAREELSGVDLILADLGLSSMQIDNPARGFTYKSHGPLDLRMNPSRGEPASAWLTRCSEEELTGVLSANADEPNAEALAAAIMREQIREPVTTTTRLAKIADAALRRHVREDEVATGVRRVFQALRIAVNDELTALDTFLRHLPACLKPEGRVAILTFHSGEDRRVKKAFQAGIRDNLYKEIEEEVIRPSSSEIHANPRASSAKFRWAIRA